MINKFIKHSEGLVIIYKGDWAADADYSAGDVAAVDSLLYLCTHGHLSASANKPGEGASWRDIWEPYGPLGDTRGISICIDGGGAVLTTGIKTGFEIPFDCKIVSGRIGSIDSIQGSIQICLWRRSFANYPPGSSNNIKTFIMNSAISDEETGLDLSINKGDWLFVVVDSVSNLKLVTLSLSLSSR